MSFTWWFIVETIGNPGRCTGLVGQAARRLCGELVWLDPTACGKFFTDDANRFGAVLRVSHAVRA